MKLLIENFYNIKHAELDFKKFNILIGPQAAGKSLIAKAYHTAVQALSLYNLSFLNEKHPEIIENRIKVILDSTFENYSKHENSKLTLSKDTSPLLTLSQSRIKISDNYLEELDLDPSDKKHILEAFRTGDNAGTYTANLLLTMVIDAALDINSPYSLFIPASRSLVNIVAENLFWMSDNNIDYLLNKFGRLYFKNIKNITSEENFNCPQLNSVIKGHIEQKNNTYIINEQGRQTTIVNSSSGQQATVPIAIALEAIKKTLCNYAFIEEPEAHIFPDAQNLLTRYIAEVHNQTGTNITLTTHSPYLLTTVNTLIYANSVASQSEEKADKVREIIPESEWLKAEDVAAYMVNGDGTVSSIFDEKEGLIVADSIDDISDVIGNAYNQLLDIEFGEEEQDD